MELRGIYRGIEWHMPWNCMAYAINYKYSRKQDIVFFTGYRSLVG